jgi:uncharacterized protein (TIGR03435 family)
MSNLIGVLSQVAGRKVLDKTGLSGQYDFTLSYSPDNGGEGSDGSNVSPAVDGFPSSVFTALSEQLGLDLEARKSQIELLVFDHIEPLIPNQRKYYPPSSAGSAAPPDDASRRRQTSALPDSIGSKAS